MSKDSILLSKSEKDFPVELLAWKRKVGRQKEFQSIKIQKIENGYIQVITTITDEHLKFIQNNKLIGMFTSNFLHAFPNDAYKIIGANFKYSSGVIILTVIPK